jgi:hypothetical protein
MKNSRASSTKPSKPANKHQFDRQPSKAVVTRQMLLSYKSGSDRQFCVLFSFNRHMDTSYTPILPGSDCARSGLSACHEWSVRVVSQAVIRSVLSCVKTDQPIWLATGYFNLTPDISQQLLTKHTSVRNGSSGSADDSP